MGDDEDAGRTAARIISATEIGAEDIAGLSIGYAFDYWRRVAQGRFAPPRVEFHLDDLPPEVIPCVTLVDFIGPPLDYYYRFFGTAMREVSGVELSGKRYYADGVEGYGFVNAKLFPQLIERRQPLFHRIEWESRNGVPFLTTSVRLPLSDDGAMVTGAVTANDFRLHLPLVEDS